MANQNCTRTGTEGFGGFNGTGVDHMMGLVDSIQKYLEDEESDATGERAQAIQQLLAALGKVCGLLPFKIVCAECV